MSDEVSAKTLNEYHNSKLLSRQALFYKYLFLLKKKFLTSFCKKVLDIFSVLSYNSSIINWRDKMNSRNLVAKHARTFNKATVQRDRTKYSRKTKHKEIR